MIQCYYRPQTKCGKVMFLHLPVSHSVQKGDVSQHAMGRGCTRPGIQPPNQTPTPRQTPPTPRWALKRAVLILLECILVRKETDLLICFSPCRYLPREVDPLVYNMSIEDPGDVNYSQIGGLGEQIRELREVRTDLAIYES